MLNKSGCNLSETLLQCLIESERKLWRIVSFWFQHATMFLKAYNLNFSVNDSETILIHAASVIMSHNESNYTIDIYNLKLHSNRHETDLFNAEISQ